MVVTDLDIVGVTVFETEADPPLVIDGNRVLPGSITCERMQAIAGRDAQVPNDDGRIKGRELAERASCYVRRQTAKLAGDPELLGPPIGERLDHRCTVTRHVTGSKTSEARGLRRGTAQWD